ncbi:hypothetical protein [Rhizobacter sp. Root1221]|uniref:hypothetical protein n=1 Tax=Rhizobacter sp. Root1221 TaxID=1736433 RepID=UPI0012F8D4B7|nr:hypothetical protein [Rhizobacter sp. Root1221]
MSRRLQTPLNALCLSFPVWALVLALGFISLFPSSSQLPGELIVAPGAIAPFVGGLPIIRMRAATVALRVVLFVLYYGCCAIVMFVVGWGALGVLGIAK